MLTGTCLCGAVSFRVEDAFEYALNCHCSQCRRATGSAFKPFAGIAVARLRHDRDRATLLCFGDAQAADWRCARCGSLLYSIVREGRYAHVPLGVLTPAPSLMPTAHIFVGSKAPWYEIRDDLPQFEALPP